MLKCVINVDQKKATNANPNVKKYANPNVRKLNVVKKHATMDVVTMDGITMDGITVGDVYQFHHAVECIVLILLNTKEKKLEVLKTFTRCKKWNY